VVGWRRRGRSLVSLIAVDTTPFRQSRDYRLLLVGGMVNQLGSQLTLVALPSQMYVITGSPWRVGLLGLVEFVPFALLSLFGGAISDRRDRRQVLVAAQVTMALITAGLAVLSAADRATPGLLYLLAAAFGAATAFDRPVRQALMMEVIPPEHLRSAVSLSYGLFQASAVIGPALGGFIIAGSSFAVAYALDAATLGVLILTVVAVRHRAAVTAEQPQRILRSVAESLSFAYTERAVLGSFVIDLVAMAFGMPKALFPVLALDVYHVGPAGTGLMFSAVSVGALAAALSAGWLGRVRRLGRVVVFAVIGWGVAIAAAGVSGSFWLALLCLALAGAADSISAVCRSTIVQTVVTDEMRGRMSAMFILVVRSGPFIGDAEAGAVASIWSPRASVTSGGLLCVVGAVAVAVLMPQLYRFDTDDYRHTTTARAGDPASDP
jgi:MFS family permease